MLSRYFLTALYVCVPLALSTIGSDANASNNEQPGPTYYGQFEDWSLECVVHRDRRKQKCELTSPVLADEDTLPGFGFAIVISEQNGKPLAYLKTPLDLLVSSGAEFSIDDRRMGKLDFRSCHRNGCVLPFIMTGTLNAKILNGYYAKFELRDLNNQPKSSSFSLKGISRAIREANKILGSDRTSEVQHN